MSKCKCGEVDEDLCPCEYFEHDDPWKDFDPDEVEWEDDEFDYDDQRVREKLLPED